MDKGPIKLSNKLQFWYQEQPVKQNYNQSLLPVGVVSTVQEFWNFYQHFKRPSQFQENNSLFFFKESIKPFWEDPGNVNGGSFILKFEQSQSSKVCEDIFLAFIAQNTGQCEEVNGIRLKVKKGLLVVEVWIPNASDEDKIDKSRDWLIKATCLNQDTTIQLVKFKVD